MIFLFNCFGLGISVIIADNVWRSGKGSFEDGWEQGRRKAGDIFMASIGLNFIVYIALQIGSFIHPLLGEALFVLAFFFLIYTIPAAAIGGIPGFMALNASIERVRENFLPAIGLIVCFVVLYWAVGTILIPRVHEPARHLGVFDRRGVPRHRPRLLCARARSLVHQHSLRSSEILRSLSLALGAFDILIDARCWWIKHSDQSLSE